MGTIIAVDIGGTHLRTAAYESEQIKPSAYQRTNTLANEPGVFDRMVKAIEEVWPHTRKWMQLASHHRDLWILIQVVCYPRQHQTA